MGTFPAAAILPFAFAITLPACFAGLGDAADLGEEEETIGEAESALEVANALNLNALNLNALNLNALNLNALTLNAMTSGAQTSLQDAGPTGQLARHTLSYIVSCAFKPDQSLSLSWIDAVGAVHDETYVGLLGLAPSWSNKPLKKDGREWISACLASRVNYYGVSVVLSSRAPHPELKDFDDEESEAFATLEGVFWGNLFTDDPEVHACYTAANVAQVRAKSRDCAAGHVGAGGAVEPCGILEIVGACDSLCEPPKAKHRYYTKCAASPGGAIATRVITVALQ